MQRTQAQQKVRNRRYSENVIPNVNAEHRNAEDRNAATQRHQVTQNLFTKKAAQLQVERSNGSPQENGNRYIVEGNGARKSQGNGINNAQNTHLYKQTTKSQRTTTV
jgi:hypothetical protein